PSIDTDPKRLLQVLKNLLSNAFKFTERGSVKLSVHAAGDGWTPGHPILDRARTVVAFAVSDTGIGIAADKQRIVFEAFQQADAGTARKHGGTGLGLAISRELAQLLGGEISLRSKPGTGSTFTLYLPASYAGPVLPAVRSDSPDAATTYSGMLSPAPRTAALVDDRDAMSPGDRVFLVVQNDVSVAARAIEAARAAGLKAVATARGTDAITLARQFRPTAVSLDVSLPDVHGWTVLSRFKHDPELRHIPVQMIADDSQEFAALARGAFSCLRKPLVAADLSHDIGLMLEFADSPKRRLLIVEKSNEGRTVEGDRILNTAGGADIETSVAETAGDALRLLEQGVFHCVAVDALQRELDARELLQRAATKPHLSKVPFVVYADRVWVEENAALLDAIGRTMIIRLASSLSGVFDECSLFLHRRVAELPAAKQHMLPESPNCDVLAGKTVLVVDDDVRNIFALSSLLERYEMRVVSAHTGRDALRLIGETKDLSLVLLDIMMPEMDGFETMRQMRGRWKFEHPIIALTAKAMSGDREKCIEAGASDYIAKPVDSENLLSLLRVWLNR
ncbi:MAG: response regulator, partial [Woeseiaceae bacterium]